MCQWTQSGSYCEVSFVVSVSIIVNILLRNRHRDTDCFISLCIFENCNQCNVFCNRMYVHVGMKKNNNYSTYIAYINKSVSVDKVD